MRSQAATGGVFRAVADPTRRRILELLRESDLSVSELARPFRMSQPAISQHLKVLRGAGLVRGRRAGRRRLYRVARRPLERVYKWAARQLADPFGHVWSLTGRDEEE
jgi:DNA-binding transcriptional ArsR family regulator